MIDRRTPQQKLDNLVYALVRLRSRYGADQISLDCFLQHAEVAIFLEQRRFQPEALSVALNQLQMIDRIHRSASSEARSLSAQERVSVDQSIDSLFGTLEHSSPSA